MQTLKPALYVSAQIHTDDLPALKAQGIAQIICHRPDGEAPDQPAFADIAAALRANPSSVRVQYTRGLSRLRKLLTRKEEG